MKRRILLIRNAFSYDFGGGERFPVDLASELSLLGYDPIIVSRSPKLLEYANTKGISAIRGWWWSRQDWSGKRLLLTPLYFFWQLLLTCWYIGLIARTRPDVVHPQSKDDFIAATLAGKLLRKRVIWTDHADLKYVYTNHQVWYKNPVGEFVFAVGKLADQITLVSQSEATLIKQSLGFDAPNNYVVIHNGVRDIQKSITPATRPAGKRIVVATSRLVTAKGIGELIEAVSKLRAHHPDLVLWLVGDGPETNKFKQLASDNNGIQFLGHQDEPLRYVKAADIFVHPSYHEGFSLSIVEAAMMQKAIVACNVGGNPEIIHDNQTGLLVSARDAPSLTDAIDRLLGDPDLTKRLAHNARKLFEDEFQFDKIVKRKFVAIYEND
jgi:glycosyltransferase involved in cell wall biosynthesis